MPYLSLDLEMSGPDPHWNEVIQIGAVLYDDNWQELGTFLSNVYPENEEAFSSHSEAIHGLTLDELNDAPMMHEVLPDFEAGREKFWVGNNLPLKAKNSITYKTCSSAGKAYCMMCSFCK